MKCYKTIQQELSKVLTDIIVVREGLKAIWPVSDNTFKKITNNVATLSTKVVEEILMFRTHRHKLIVSVHKCQRIRELLWTINTYNIFW